MQPTPLEHACTMLKAFQQLLNYLHIHKPYDDGTYGIQIVDAKYIAHLCKTNYGAYRKLISVDMLDIDDLGTEPSEVLDYGNVYTPVIDLLPSVMRNNSSPSSLLTSRPPRYVSTTTTALPTASMKWWRK